MWKHWIIQNAFISRSQNPWATPTFHVVPQRPWKRFEGEGVICYGVREASIYQLGHSFFANRFPIIVLGSFGTNVQENIVTTKQNKHVMHFNSKVTFQHSNCKCLSRHPTNTWKWRHLFQTIWPKKQRVDQLTNRFQSLISLPLSWKQIVHRKKKGVSISKTNEVLVFLTKDSRLYLPLNHGKNSNPYIFTKHASSTRQTGVLNDQTLEIKV